jgi:acyl-CoA reductase-like NAD-dependent aldehyde dehydrogenase
MNSRVPVLKTYKIFIGGQFPRTESGRYYDLKNKQNKVIANICLSTAFNRSQILYRIAEMLEGRKAQFEEEMILMGYTKTKAASELNQSIDRLIHYAGWSDKYMQLFSSVNPVASSHFNFSVPEPTGVVSIIADETTALLGLISVIAPAIAGGNTVVILASEKLPLCAITFAEVLATSDLPAGVVNILTGTSEELHAQFSSHMDVNAVVYCRNNKSEEKTIFENAALIGLKIGQRKRIKIHI